MDIPTYKYISSNTEYDFRLLSFSAAKEVTKVMRF